MPGYLYAMSFSLSVEIGTSVSLGSLACQMLNPSTDFFLIKLLLKNNNHLSGTVSCAKVHSLRVPLA